MDADKYQELAVQTLAPPTAEAKQRLLALNLSYDMTLAFRSETASGFEFDAIKRVVFYGKQPKHPHSEMLMVRIKESELLMSQGNDHHTRNAVVHSADYISDEMMNAVHAIIGVKTECSELFETLLKLHAVPTRVPFSGAGIDPTDKQNLIEEAGDVLWYVAILCHAIGVPMSAVMEANNAKLLKGRFKSGSFNADNAETRDTKEEMKHLDSAVDAATLPGKDEPVEELFSADEADACYSIMESATESITLTDTLAALLRAEHCPPEIDDILRRIEQNNDETRNKIRIATDRLA